MTIRNGRRNLERGVSTKKEAEFFARASREIGYTGVRVVAKGGSYDVTADAVKRVKNSSMKTPKLGKWIQAKRVRVVKVNGAKVLEIQRTVKKAKRPKKRKR